mmetsp:Transcript_4395/g.13850  ORF Transcript_4395/g.13850 Transcript_4395/m.13850 type:complete len:317 (+) Transcript_4395:2408-3358(+)
MQRIMSRPDSTNPPPPGASPGHLGRGFGLAGARMETQSQRLGATFSPTYPVSSSSSAAACSAVLGKSSKTKPCHGSRFTASASESSAFSAIEVSCNPSFSSASRWMPQQTSWAYCESLTAPPPRSESLTARPSLRSKTPDAQAVGALRPDLTCSCMARASWTSASTLSTLTRKRSAILAACSDLPEKDGPQSASRSGNILGRSASAGASEASLAARRTSTTHSPRRCSTKFPGSEAARPYASSARAANPRDASSPSEQCKACGSPEAGAETFSWRVLSASSCDSAMAAATVSASASATRPVFAKAPENQNGGALET